MPRVRAAEARQVGTAVTNSYDQPFNQPYALQDATKCGSRRPPMIRQAGQFAVHVGQQTYLPPVTFDVPIAGCAANPDQWWLNDEDLATGQITVTPAPDAPATR